MSINCNDDSLVLFAAQLEKIITFNASLLLLSISKWYRSLFWCRNLYYFASENVSDRKKVFDNQFYCLALRVPRFTSSSSLFTFERTNVNGLLTMALQNNYNNAHSLLSKVSCLCQLLTSFANLRGQILPKFPKVIFMILILISIN